MSLFQPVIILVRPRNPNNIGACARAMANFGLAELRVVDPYSPVWNETVAAVDAEEIIKNAAVMPDLKTALEDCHYSFATTSGQRRQPLLPLARINDIESHIRKHTEKNAKIAFIFGSEKTGLTNEDILLANSILNIPTSTAQPSLNLSHAVAITCYTVSLINGVERIKYCGRAPQSVTAGGINALAQEISDLLDKTGIKKSAPQNRETEIRKQLAGLALNKTSFAFLMSLFKALGRKLR